MKTPTADFARNPLSRWRRRRDDTIFGAAAFKRVPEVGTAALRYYVLERDVPREDIPGRIEKLELLARPELKSVVGRIQTPHVGSNGPSVWDMSTFRAVGFMAARMVPKYAVVCTGTELSGTERGTRLQPRFR